MDFMSLNVGLDLQETYDKALALASAWRVAADTIEKGIETKEVIAGPDGEPVGLTVTTQAAYRDAVVMEESWLAFAEKIAKLGRVCVHPEGRRTTLESGLYICQDCGKMNDGA